jgi:hypothetical protein
VDPASVIESIGGTLLGAGVAYGVMRTRLGRAEKDLADHTEELKKRRDVDDELKEKLHARQLADAHTINRIELLERAEQDRGYDFEQFEHKFERETKEQNKLINSLTVAINRATTAPRSFSPLGGQRAAVDPRVEESDSPPPPRPRRLSQTNE